MRPKLAAVVSSTNAHRAPFWTKCQDGSHAGAHGGGDCIRGEAVDNNLQNRRDVGVERAVTRPLQGRAISIICRSDYPFIFRADLGAGTRDAAREMA